MKDSYTGREQGDRMGSVVLADRLARDTVRGELWYTEADRIRCVACAHRCRIAPGRAGICKVRFNRSGELRVPYGYIAGLQSDPVEKKPFFHVLPGVDALTFGMLGCDFHCGYCQNWVTSQALRDPSALTPVQSASPKQLVDAAQRLGSGLVVSSYNEPLITAEWAVAVFKEARTAGLRCAFVSNGNATPEALDYLKPWIAAYKVDLKGFDDQRYRSLGGILAHVCRGIELVLERGIWLEVVTLVVPGFNDSESELRQMARFIASCSRDIPWHVTAFHPDYKMTDHSRTEVEPLVRAAEIGSEEGLRYVYAGNAPGRVGRWESTHCPSCEQVVVARAGYQITGYRLTRSGHCENCGSKVPGLWSDKDKPALSKDNLPADGFRRAPRSVTLEDISGR